MRKISSVAYGFIPIKIQFFWLTEKFNQQNKWILCNFQYDIAKGIFYWKKNNNISFIYNCYFGTYRMTV